MNSGRDVPEITVSELTARGPGAISIVSVRGNGALESVRAILVPAVGARVGVQTSTAPALARRRPILGRPELFRLRIGDEDLDEAIVCALSEREVELHVHGSPPLVRALLAHWAQPAPVRTVRTLEERAVERLAAAPCAAAARILLDQAEGALRRDLERALRSDPDERERLLRELSERGRVAAFALERTRVVIAGRVNAGKSTLFNALVGERRALVSDEPGTTRDPVREHAELGAYPVELIDTAGEREIADGDEIEREGQRRARAESSSADLVLWLEPVDAERSRPPVRGVRIATCADRRPGESAGAISALRAPQEAREFVARLFRAELDLPEDPWIRGAGVPFDPELRRSLAALVGRPLESTPELEELLQPRAP